jgi:hypothetical protein
LGRPRDRIADANCNLLAVVMAESASPNGRPRFTERRSVANSASVCGLATSSSQLTVFPDGRTIVSGTDDVAVARSLQAKYIGS